MNKYFLKTIIDTVHQEIIIDIIDNLPTTPNKGDRYILNSDKKIYLYDGNQWINYLPENYSWCFVINKGAKYQYINGNWYLYPYSFYQELIDNYSTSSNRPTKVEKVNFTIPLSGRYQINIKFQAHTSRSSGWYSSYYTTSHILFYINDDILIDNIKSEDPTWSAYSTFYIESNLPSGDNSIDIYMYNESRQTAYMRNPRIMIIQI